MPVFILLALQMGFFAAADTANGQTGTQLTQPRQLVGFELKQQEIINHSRQHKAVK